MKTHTQAYFNYYTNHFYFFTYNNASDFISGYTSSVSNDIEYSTNNIKINFTYKSPFEFEDEVEIKEIKFLLYTYFVYYEIYNKVTMKTYHGIFDIRINRIMLNTDEDIDLFIPYSNISMLAITKSTAYKTCIIQGNNIDTCLGECPTGTKLKLDIDGNECVSGENPCGSKFLLIPEEICISICNTSKFILIDNKCGLCRDIGPENEKYK